MRNPKNAMLFCELWCFTEISTFKGINPFIFKVVNVCPNSYIFCSKMLLGSQQAQNFLVFENRFNRTDFIAVLVFLGPLQN